MPRLLTVLALTSIVVTGAARCDLAAHREFDPDEFQHLHAAWCISQGLLPYRDFYEHHMPALPVLLSATLPVASAGHSPQDVASVMLAARRVSWAVCAIVIALTWALGTHVGGTPVGAVASTLLTFSIVFTGKGMEIRPDGAETVFWLVSLLAWIAALKRPANRRLLYFLSGLALGTALLFTQKLVMAAPGLAAISLWTWAAEDARRTRAQRVRDTGVQVCGVLIPIGAMAGWFAAHDAGGVFLRATLFQNLGWIQETSAGHTLSWLALRDPVLAVLGAVGAVQAIAAMARRQLESAGVVTLMAGAAVVLGLFAIPAPYPQYLLPALPLLAVFAATLLVDIHRPSHLAWAGAGVIAGFGLLLAWARPTFMTSWAYPAVLAASLVLAATLVRRHAPAAIAVVLVAGSLYQAQQLRWMQGLSSGRQMAGMALVHRLTSGNHPSVLDGFTGYGWFRMHAWKYPFLHGGVRARISDADRHELADGLRSGRIAPGAVLFDVHLHAVSPDVADAIRDGFVRTDTEPVWRRAAPGKISGVSR